MQNVCLRHDINIRYGCWLLFPLIPLLIPLLLCLWYTQRLFVTIVWCFNKRQNAWPICVQIILYALYRVKWVIMYTDPVKHRSNERLSKHNFKVLKCTPVASQNPKSVVGLIFPRLKWTYIYAHACVCMYININDTKQLYNSYQCSLWKYQLWFKLLRPCQPYKITYHIYCSTEFFYIRVAVVADLWHKHIEAETKWTPFRRRHFQTHFCE